MPRFVFLDTNKWIYLANGFNICQRIDKSRYYRMADAAG
jgi:hypothetical protein